MVRFSFVFLIVFAIGSLSAIHGSLATSVVPGWHTPIYPPGFFASLFQVVWLGVASAIYYFIERKGKVVNRNHFQLHLFFSLFIFIDIGYAFLEYDLAERFVTIVQYVLFLLGQFIFLIDVLKAKKIVNHFSNLRQIEK